MLFKYVKCLRRSFYKFPKTVNQLFYLTSRKANLSIIMITQNVFAQGKFALTIRRQFQYLIGNRKF